MISPVKVWRNQAVLTRALGKKGLVVSYTTIRVGPSGFEAQIPYSIAIVELENEDRVVGQIVDCNEKDVRIGLRVEAVLRRVREPDREGVIPYGIKFRPIPQ